jgi:outer membrane protein TolC
MKQFIYPLLIFCITAGYAQQSVILDDYIKQGFESNLILKQKQFDLDKSLISLKDAKNLYLPTAEFDADYTLAKGGRRLQFPVGDLLNPVYQTLNQMTGTDKFPQINNVDEQLTPNNFHNTKIRIIHPLLNWEIKYNRDIKQEMITMQQAEVNLYKRQLVADIKTAYFNYLKATKAIEIYRNASKVVQENVRVNEKLVKNQMATSDVVLRAKAELAEIDFQLKQAENNQKVAQNYLNFLLNRSLETPVSIDSTISEKQISFQDEKSLEREEFAKLNSALRLNETQLRLSKSYKLPTINHVLDLGYQGFGYTFAPNQQLALYNISLKWVFFNGNRNQYKISQTLIDKKNLETQKELLDDQVKLQIQNARYALYNTQESLESATSALKNAEAYFKIVSRKYAEGQSPMIEYLDARNKLTTAQLRQNITEYDILIKAAEVEKVTAGYDIK